MLKHRVIPCVLLKDWQLVKSINFESYRTIGHPISTARIYNARNVDELIVLDIDASLHNKDINIEAIKDIADECFMPLTIGGGIKSIDDIYDILNAGADKISINSIALTDLEFIKESSSIFGSQCIVCSIDVKKIDETYKVFNKNKGVLDIDLLTLAKQYQKYGAGEILLTSVDKDGSANGYDINLIKLFRGEMNIPIILNGGMGKPIHAVEAIKYGADAVAAAYIYHFSQYTPEDVKKEMNRHNIPTRYSHSE
jgi:imidazole glycerol-phosphate synthase subunit HisF